MFASMLVAQVGSNKWKYFLSFSSAVAIIKCKWQDDDYYYTKLLLLLLLYSTLLSLGVCQPCGSSQLFFGKQQLLFFTPFPLYVCWAAVAFFAKSPLSSPLFCRWWNCPSPYIIWNMSWWSRTYEELGIISSRPYITFSSLLCYDALML